MTSARQGPGGGMIALTSCMGCGHVIAPLETPEPSAPPVTPETFVPPEPAWKNKHR
jgi:hypothetical protein